MVDSLRAQLGPAIEGEPLEAASADLPAPPARSRRSLALRLGALAAFVVIALAVGHQTGLAAHLDKDVVAQAMRDTGVLGPLLLVAGTAVGMLLHIPGFVFVGGAVLAYGPLGGGALGFGAGMIAITISFVVVRAIGGKALGEIQKPAIRRAMAHLDRRPIQTVVLLRTVFQMAPPLNYALALSPLRTREFVLGSALGLAVPVAIASVAFDWLFQQDMGALARAAGPWAGLLAGLGIIAWIAWTIGRARCRRQPITA